MILRLLLDDANGYDLITVNEAGLGSRPDSFVLEYARQQERVLLTRNCDDFQALHQANPVHYGILAIYQNPDSQKNMSYQEIVQAIANIEIANYSLANQFVILNQWNY